MDGRTSITSANYKVDADLDRNGIINSNDYNLANAIGTQAAMPAGQLSGVSPGYGGTATAVNTQNIVGYCGYLYNSEDGLYTVRFRHYDPSPSGGGRWLERDPLGYVDGMNRYEYCSNSPINAADSFGLEKRSGYSWDNLPDWVKHTYESEYGIRDGRKPSGAAGASASSEVVYWSFYKWLYAGDGYASDELYEEATNGGAESYVENAGDAHRALQAVAAADPTGLAKATDGALTGLEGSTLNAQVMAPPVVALPPTASQVFSRNVGRYIPWVLRGLAFWEMLDDASADDDDGSGSQRTPEENRKAREYFKNHKQEARDDWSKREGEPWPKGEGGNGEPWPAEHTPPLKEGGDPMIVTPRDPGEPDPHNISGPDGLTDYQRWGKLGAKARDAKKKCDP